MRPTPFSFVFGGIAAERFPAIAEALQQEGSAPTDRDQFVLLEPVARLLGDMVPPESAPEALEAHLLLLHHAYMHWANAGWVYRVGEHTLRRAITDDELSSNPTRPALYLQLPELRVWGSPAPNTPPEPLDGMFVSVTQIPGKVSVLAIFGMRPNRPGFSAVSLEGRADPEDATGNEIEIAATRTDGSAPFGPIVAGGSAAGLHSVANAGELLLLTCRLLAQLPSGGSADPAAHSSGALEHVVQVD